MLSEDDAWSPRNDDAPSVVGLGSWRPPLSPALEGGANGFMGRLVPKAAGGTDTATAEGGEPPPDVIGEDVDAPCAAAASLRQSICHCGSSDRHTHDDAGWTVVSVADTFHTTTD